MLFLKLRYSYNEIVKIQNFLHLTFQTQKVTLKSYYLY